MIKFLTIILFCFLSLNTYSQISSKKLLKLKIKSGVYATYYKSAKESKDFEPAYNIIYENGKGYYWTGNPEFGYQGSECYNWKLENDILIFDTYKSEYVNEKKCIDNSQFKQFWKIVDMKKNELHLKLFKEQNSDGETLVNEIEQEIYILKRIGDRL